MTFKKQMTRVCLNEINQVSIKEVTCVNKYNKGKWGKKKKDTKQKNKIDKKQQ